MEELDRKGKKIEGVEWVGCKVKTQNEDLNIVGVYRTPRFGYKKIRWGSLCNIVKKNNENLIIAGDFNAYNTVWNCRSTDRIGEELWEEFRKICV